MTARLLIAGNGYVLARRADGGGWTELARLAGGAAALLPAAGRIGEAQLEAAIERAEDWLMPHAAALQGQILDVHDETGRLAEGLQSADLAGAREWNTEALEALFLRLVDRTLGRFASQADEPAFIAHVLLLRELAHHGKLARVRLAG
ncbi:hypothetical protein PE066_18090 [Ramlibacter tataouinensis]|uniref:hypothetical protein n=1 Tax=Ramlibacter tataouinensis TaxID=94132 RepID=UPI0022F3CCC5|nr:hypothetical protein [Ramlibacter tataouinensis]WBY01352.1 hypothetical protein PE066_18090 [Ramlibacter tataouinensis]